MLREIVHPDMLAHLADFYPQLCTIEEPVYVTDPGGEKRITNYVPFAGHSDLPCAVGRPGGGEQKLREATPSITTFRIALRGYYPTITRVMRAVVNGQAYDILDPLHDQHLKMSYLDCGIAEL